MNMSGGFIIPTFYSDGAKYHTYYAPVIVHGNARPVRELKQCWLKPRDASKYSLEVARRWNLQHNITPPARWQFFHCSTCEHGAHTAYAVPQSSIQSFLEDGIVKIGLTAFYQSSGEDPEVYMVEVARYGLTTIRDHSLIFDLNDPETQRKFSVQSRLGAIS